MKEFLISVHTILSLFTTNKDTIDVLIFIILVWKYKEITGIPLSKDNPLRQAGCGTIFTLVCKYIQFSLECKFS